ncbi:unnamed protein product [Closterium sp. NIES-64]|nr:unnamed protein product [Closterium sp. NIES-64]
MAESTLLARSPAKYSSLSAFSPTRIPRSACSPSPRAALPSRIPITAFAATRHDSPPSPLLTRPRASPLGTSQRVTRLSRVPLLSPAPGQSHQTSNVSEYSRSAECKRRGAVVSRAFLLPVDPWSPNVDSQSIASSLFAVSLFPYLGFLYFLTRSGTAPRITLFGFYFLLAFVGATIPAGIYAVVDAAFAAAEAIATGVPVTGGVRALGAAADVADDLPSLVDTSARRDLGEEAWKKGTRREIPITEADFEREGIQEDEELLDKDEPMEALVNVMFGEEPGADGGGGEDVEEVERSPPLESQAASAKDKAAEETKSSPAAAAGEEFTGSGSRAAGRWSLRSHEKTAENEERKIQEVQEQETRRVKVRMGNNEVTYEINTTAPLKNMFALFCQRLHLPEGGGDVRQEWPCYSGKPDRAGS